MGNYSQSLQQKYLLKLLKVTDQTETTLCSMEVSKKDVILSSRSYICIYCVCLHSEKKKTKTKPLESVLHGELDQELKFV